MSTESLDASAAGVASGDTGDACLAARRGDGSRETDSRRSDSQGTASRRVASVRVDALRNRSILLDTARHVFSVEGPDASLSRIVEESGLGRGSLYRHFPNRFLLISAIFDENFAELESIAREVVVSSRRFVAVFSTLVRQLVDARGFISLLFGRQGHDADFSTHQLRLRNILEDISGAAPVSEVSGARLSVDDLVLLIGMLTGIAVSAPRQFVFDHIERALALTGCSNFLDLSFVNSDR